MCFKLNNLFFTNLYTYICKYKSRNNFKTFFNIIALLLDIWYNNIIKLEHKAINILYYNVKLLLPHMSTQ